MMSLSECNVQYIDNIQYIDAHLSKSTRGFFEFKLLNIFRNTICSYYTFTQATQVHCKFIESL
jgi:hypothetical protein